MAHSRTTPAAHDSHVFTDIGSDGELVSYEHRIGASMTATARTSNSKPKKTIDELIAAGVLPERPRKKTFEEIVELGLAEKYPPLPADAPDELRNAPSVEEFFGPSVIFECDKQEWRDQCNKILADRKAAKHARREEKRAKKEQKKADNQVLGLEREEHADVEDSERSSRGKQLAEMKSRERVTFFVLSCIPDNVHVTVPHWLGQALANQLKMLCTLVSESKTQDAGASSSVWAEGMYAWVTVLFKTRAWTKKGRQTSPDLSIAPGYIASDSRPPPSGVCYIAALPVELLFAIVKIYAEAYPPIPGVNASRHADFLHNSVITREIEEPQWLRDRKGSIGWILLRQVCRSWEDAIAGMHSLWADEIGALPKGLDGMLSKTGEHRSIYLRLYGSSYRGDPEGVLTRMLTYHSSYFPRISSILYTETRRNARVTDSLYNFLAQGHFPALETVHIFANEARWNLASHRAVPQLPTPSLRRLGLTNVTCFTAATALTSLELTAPLEHPADGRPWLLRASHLRDMLTRYCNSLVNLRIGMIMSHLDNSFEDQPRIVFPRLKHLSYFDHSTRNPEAHPIVLFTWIRYTLMTHVTINLELSSESPGFDIVWILLAVVNAGSQHPTAISIRKLASSDPPDMTSLQFRCHRASPASTHEVYPYTSAEWAERFLTLKFHIEGAPTSDTSVMTSMSVMSAFVLATNPDFVRALRLDDLSFAESQLLLSTFRSVDSLALACDCMEEEIGFLCNRNDDGTLRLPQLRALSLSFGPQSTLEPISTSDLVKKLGTRVGVTQFPFGAVHDLPATRITHLRVDEWVVVDADEEGYESWVEDLRTVVDNVDWSPTVVGGEE
ncbi:hypothetical protein PENSPDRAFT_668706 [Peniophora sp. CONT]|nr:hypothetical protein PENSPDRAFT_668706 [Peniophora sp. CONT]